MTLSELLDGVNRQYDSISAACNAFLSGEISGKEFNALSMQALETIDNQIADYKPGE